MSANTLRSWVQEITSTDKVSRLCNTLVVARTTDIADSFRRALAQLGGGMGVEVTTLRGLALKTCPPIPLSEPIQPIDNPLLQRLGPDGARTGLESLLMAHVGEIRLHDLYAASPLSATSLPNGMPALTQISWGETESEVAIRTFIQRLEQRADAPRKGPLAAEAYDRVLAVGFGANPSESSPLGTDESDFLNTWSQGVGDSLDPVSAWERTALRLLGAIALAPEIGTSQMATSIPVVEVPDVLAEARLCVRTILHAAPTGSDRSVLVLVANPQTAARLSTVGTANALPIGRRGALQLSGHPAALVFRNAAPWFSGVTDPYLRASSLERVFGGPCVTWKFPAPVRDRLAKQIQGLPQIDGAPITEGRETSISGNALRELLHNARIANAPLSAWRERIHVLAEPMDGDDTRPTWRVTSRRRPAIVLLARLDRLVDWVAGRHPDAAATDANVRHVEATGTLGLLRQFVLDSGLKLYNDEGARAINTSLKAAFDQAASMRSLNVVLNSSTRTAQVDLGIDVLPYDAYDGRAVDVLVLLDLHDKGLTSLGAPDPLISEALLAELGSLTGRRAALRRLLNAKSAAGAAKFVLAIATQRDATGRAVVPPIELQLDVEAGVALVGEFLPDAESTHTDSFGHRLHEFPENDVRKALKVMLSKAEAANLPSAPVGEPTSQHLAVQATTEWYRAGLGAAPLVPNTPPIETLAQKLTRLGPLGPDWVHAYVGTVDPDSAPTSWSKDADGHSVSWSVSRDFTPLTNSLYRYFADRVLRIREQDTISDELDARQIGNAVHDAFENSNIQGEPQVQWRVPEADLENARLNALELLSGHTVEAMNQAVDELGHTTPAVTHTTKALGQRWSHHLGSVATGTLTGYVTTRVKSVESGQDAAQKWLLEQMQEVDAFTNLTNTLYEMFDMWPARSENKVAKWLRWALCAQIEGEDLSALEPKALLLGDGAHGVPKSKRELEPVLSTFIQRQDFLELAVFLQPLLLEWRRSMRVLSGLFVAVEPELPFGIESAAASERPGVAHLLASHLSLPSGDRPVRGKADRVMVFLGNGESVAEILDYKTGAAKSKRALCEGMQTLELPQLPIYALALRNALKAAAAAGESHILDLPVDTVVRSLGYDFAKNAGKGGLLDDFLIDDADLNAYETAIDTLVVAAERGRWALHPLKDDEMGRASWGFPRGIVSLREASRYEGPPGTRPSLEDPSSDEQTSEGGTQ